LKKLVLLFVAVIVLMLVGCSDKEALTDEPEDKQKETETTENETDVKQEETEKEDHVLTKIGESTKDTSGIVTLEKIKRVDKIIKEDPIIVELLDIKVLSRNDMTQEFIQYVSQFTPISGDDGLKTIQVRYNMKNTSGHDIYWNGLTHVITDQDEQINLNETEYIRSVNVYEPTFKGIEKKYVQSFVIQNPNIKDVRMIFDSVNDYDTDDKVVERFEYEFSFD